MQAQKLTNLPRAVASQDVLQLIACALDGPKDKWLGLRDSALLTLLYGTGLRISEALALRATILKRRMTCCG